MHGPLRLTYALLTNYMAKCQMSSGPFGPIFKTKMDSSGFIKVHQGVPHLPLVHNVPPEPSLVAGTGHQTQIAHP